MDTATRALKQNAGRMQPAMMTASTIHAAYALADGGIGSSLTDIVLPAFIAQFGPGMCANLVYKQGDITGTSLVTFFAGIVLFSLFSHVSLLRPASAVFPVVSKGLQFAALKNSDMPFHLIAARLVVSEAVSALIQKLLFNKKKMNIPSDRLGELLFLVLGLGLGRMYALPDHAMMLMVFLVALGPLVQGMLSSVSLQRVPAARSVGRPPKRKAAQRARESPKQK